MKVTDQAIIAAHGVAMTSNEMASMLEVHPRTVSIYLKRLSLVSPGRVLASLPGPTMRREQPHDRERKAHLVSALANGYRSMQSVADEMGLSKERVRQLALRYGITWPVKPDLRPRCSRCNRLLPKNDRYHGLCRQHAHPGRLTYCDWCHKPIPLTYSRYRAGLRSHPLRQGPQQHHFCNRTCLGHWTAMHYGVHGLERRPRAIACQRCGTQFSTTSPKTYWCPACQPAAHAEAVRRRYHRLHPNAAYRKPAP